MVLKSKYLSQDALENLKHYKYSSIDLSFISRYILRYYWEWAVTLFPLWMAPNLITLLGLGFVVFNFFLILIYTPDLATDGPSWIYFSFAIGIWLYSTFDNVDGKQARRTGSSSPLGELFDQFGGIVQAAGLNMGHSWYTATLMMVTISTFFFSTWETFHTHTLFLGYINGPTEGLLISVATLIISGLYGPSFWWKKVADLIPSSSSPSSSSPYSLIINFIPPSLKLVDCMIIFLVVSAVFTQIPVSILRVIQFNKRNGNSVANSIVELIPFLAYIISCFAWMAAPKSTLISQHIILFYLIIGFIFGRVATKVILAHVTKMEYPYFTVLYFPLYLGAILANLEYFGYEPYFTPERETNYLWMFLGFVLLNYGYWSISIIQAFCHHLNIECLRIPDKSPKKQN